MSVSAVLNKTLICNGQSATLTASGATGYSWVNGPATAGNTVSPTSALTVYTVNGTHATNTCVATRTIGVAVITPSVTYSSSLNVCAGKDAILTASGASSYTWNGFPTPSGSYTTTPTASTGATLITVRGGAVSLHTADLLGLASGITAGVGVMSLRQIRKTDSTFNVLFFTFLLGTVVSVLLIVFESLVADMPALSAYPARFWYLLLLSGVCGVAGQWVFTYGFAYVGAVEGSTVIIGPEDDAVVFDWVPSVEQDLPTDEEEQ